MLGRKSTWLSFDESPAGRGLRVFGGPDRLATALESIVGGLRRRPLVRVASGACRAGRVDHRSRGFAEHARVSRRILRGRTLSADAALAVAPRRVAGLRRRLLLEGVLPDLAGRITALGDH